MTAFSHWIKEHANEQIKQLYADCYNDAFADIPLLQSADISAWLTEINCNSDEVPDICKSIDNLNRRREALWLP